MSPQSNTKQLIELLQDHGDGVPGRARMSLPEMNQALSLVDQGVDYALDDGIGGNLLSCLMKEVASANQQKALLERMIKTGCNPLRLSTNHQNDLFEDADMRRVLVDQLGGLELKGEGLRNEQGGNLYHAMAKINSWRLEDELKDLVAHKERAGLAGDGSPQRAEMLWLNAPRDDGANPIQVLWNRETLYHDIQQTDGLDQGVAGEAALEYHMDLLNARFLQITLAFIQAGGDILAIDNEGVCAWDLICARRAKGFPPVAIELFNQIGIHAETRILARDTPQATAAAKMSRRL